MMRTLINNIREMNVGTKAFLFILVLFISVIFIIKPSHSMTTVEKNCIAVGDYTELTDVLKKENGESSSFVLLAKNPNFFFELYLNKETGSWTFFLVNFETESSCVLEIGSGFIIQDMKKDEMEVMNI